MESCGDDMDLVRQTLTCLSNWMDARLIPIECVIASELLVIPFAALVCCLDQDRTQHEIYF